MRCQTSTVPFNLHFTGLEFFVIVLIFVVVFSSSAFADEIVLPQTASRAAYNCLENGQIIFYESLNEAIEAAAGISIDSPEEIILLADYILDEPIIIPDGKHIRLVSNGDRIISRGSGLLEYPLFWISGNNASFSLGKADMSGNIVIDGGYLNAPPVEAKAPLVAVSGQYSKFVMYDNVTLQNNYSISSSEGISIYRNGAGIFIRTFEGSPENQAEFIMKGGTIRGNINNTQNLVPCGGGVLITGFGLFTMEGGIIMNNTAYGDGGGFHTGSRGSFKKTGGIIYGRNAPKGYQNISVHSRPKTSSYGHAVSVALIYTPSTQYRNDTVGEDDYLSYIGSPTGNGVFGEGEQWNNTAKETRTRMMIILLSALILAAVGFFIVKKSRRQKTALNIESADFSPREKEIFDMLLTDKPLKEIAYTLNISYSGVIFHSKNIYRKLNVQSRTELLVKFHKNP